MLLFGEERFRVYAHNNQSSETIDADTEKTTTITFRHVSHTTLRNALSLSLSLSLDPQGEEHAALVKFLTQNVRGRIGRG